MRVAYLLLGLTNSLSGTGYFLRFLQTPQFASAASIYICIGARRLPLMRVRPKKMHASTDIRKVKCFDGLNVAFGLIENSYNGLHEECCKLINKKANPIDVLSRCWSIIDNIHRVREISQSTPGLSNKNESFRSFLTKTTVAENFRHYIQHLTT